MVSTWSRPSRATKTRTAVSGTRPPAAGIDTWLVRGDPAAGGLVPDTAVRVFVARLGRDHVLTIAGAPHAPQRTHPKETAAAVLAALGQP